MTTQGTNDVQSMDFEQIGPIALDFYLWIAHGSNVSSEQNYYPIETKFQAINLYSSPREIIYAEFLEKLSQKIKTTTPIPELCNLISGTCSYIPIINEKKNVKVVYLPPLIFGTISDPLSIEHKYIGLWHFKVHKTDLNGCQLLENPRLIFNADYLSSVSSVFTYSNIFKYVVDDCVNQNIDPTTILLGIWSCQALDKRYINEYEQNNITSLIPKRIDITLPKSKILESVVELQDSKFYSPITIVTEVPDNTIQSWETLAEIKTQGCGLNVLSFYGLLETRSAREQATCLSLKGTSIFTITDYIVQYLKNSKPYFILRYPKIEGITILDNFINNYKTNKSYAIIFKVYKELYQNQPNNYKLSELGHTVSIYVNIKNTVKTIYYIDPQTKKLQDITSNIINSLTNILSWCNFIDIIFSEQSIISPHYIKQTIEQELKKSTFYWRPRPDITYGGYKYKNFINYPKKKRKTIRQKNRKTIRQKNRTKTRNTKKSYIYHRGGADSYYDFKQMMTDIDKKNGIKTSLITSPII
jgi:hypothetical protein